MKIVTVLYRGQHFEIDDAQRADYPADKVTEFNLQFKPATGDSAAELLRRMNAGGVRGAGGTVADAESYEAARGLYLAHVLLSGWDLKQTSNGVESDLALNEANINNLPPAVCIHVSQEFRTLNRLPSPEQVAAEGNV